MTDGNHPASAERCRETSRSILVIESDADLGRGLVEQLAADDHPARLALSAGHATSLAAISQPALLVLGALDSPRGALDLLEEIRRHNSTGGEASPWQADIPVIVVGTSTQEPDILRAFDAGADDFIARPARYLELRARVRALMARTAWTPSKWSLRVGPLEINTAAYTASLHDQRLALRRLEYELLVHLAGDPGRVFHRHELLKAVWGYQASGCTRTLDSHASRLRRKLTTSGERWIINVRGIGYRLL